MNNDETRENALYAFAVEPNHNRETLDRYLKKYPQLAKELIDLSSELRLQASSAPPSATPIDDPGLEDAWANFSSIYPDSIPVTNPFAKFRGQELVDLCASLRLPRSVVIAMRDCLLVPDSIPVRLIDAISNLSGETRDAVRQYFDQSPKTPATIEFKADKKPTEIERRTFEQLIEDTELTDEQHKSVMEYFGNGQSN